MSGPLRAKMLVILGVLLWGIYSLIPTFLDETAEEKLARQALEADSGPIVDDTERLPEAANLPPDLRFQVLSALPDCRTACKSYDSNPNGFEWVREYYTGDGQTARERCAQNAIVADEREACGVEALTACTQACSADPAGGHTDAECAQACLDLNNELPTAPDWILQYYADTVNSTFNTCIGTKSQDYFETETCVNQHHSACISSCQTANEEELPFWASTVLAVYPSARLSLGLDLQGGIDLDLDVEIEEAIVSSVQRDLSSIREFAEEDDVQLVDVRRSPGEAVVLLQPSEGQTLGSIESFLTKRFQDSSPAGVFDKYTYIETKSIDVDGQPAEFYAFAVSEDAREMIATRSIEQALETLRSRIDETGVKEPSIVLKGGSRINVQLPGVDDVTQAMAAIGTAAVLEFMMVDEDTMKNPRDLERALLDAEKTLENSDYIDDGFLSDHLVRNNSIPVGSRLMWEYRELPEGGKERTQYYVVQDEVILTGDDINDASVSVNQYNEPYVAMEFKPRGAQVFEDVTGANIGRRFAIVLDKEVRSAPVIRSRIAGGRASIEMGVGDYQMALQEANVLSLVLRTGALPAPVTVGKVRTVGASLGADAISAGKRATVLGFGIVLAFMFFIYRGAGLVSWAALGINIVLVMALLATVGATLTLPGIAGIALTIGMAVDCNIIIYERIREERNFLKNDKQAVSIGFDKALVAVVDANITTFIAGVVLYTYGTGPIKGFAVTLMIGIVTTLFTGVFVSRALIEFMIRKPSAKLSI